MSPAQTLPAWQAALNTLLARLLIGFLIPLALFGGVVLLALAQIRQLGIAAGWEQHTHVVIDQAHRMRENVVAIRLTAQGYAIDGAMGGVIGDVERDQRDFEQHARDLRALVAQDNADQTARLDEVIGLERRWYESLRSAFRAAEGQADPRAAFVTAFQPTVKASDETLARIDSLLGAEDRLMGDRRAATRRSTKQAYILIAGTAILAAGIAIGTAVAAARGVARPVARIGTAARSLVDGRFEMVTPTGPTELERLAVLFNHMGLSLSSQTDELRAASRRFEQYIGATSQLLWTTDAAGLVSADMPTWRQYAGMSYEQVRGTGWLAALHPEDRDPTRRAWQAAVADGGPFEHEYRLRSAAGEYRTFVSRGAPVRGPDGEVREYVGTCTDVTDRHREAELRHATAAAEAKSRTKSEFLAKMSHELRTPLNAVIGMSRMLASQRFGPLNAKQADYLGDIVRSGQHLLNLINDVLDIAKVEAGKMDVQADRLAFAATLADTAKPFGPQAEAKGVTLRVDLPDRDGDLHTDGTRFRQILDNLLSNAVKFTPAGGTVSLRGMWVEALDARAAACDELRAAACRVEVHDTGIGIAPEDQDAVWDEFRQAKPQAGLAPQGTGLGLALTRRLVQLLGGLVWLESAPGAGSSFSLLLPRHLPRGSAEMPSLATMLAAPARSKPLVLVIEDYPATRLLLLDWLADAGLAAQWAGDGVTGLDMARRLHPRAIVLDVGLPRMDGWTVLTQLRADPRLSRTPVVVISVDDEGPAPRGIDVADFMVKPLEREQFISRLRDRLPELFSVEPAETLA